MDVGDIKAPLMSYLIPLYVTSHSEMLIAKSQQKQLLLLLLVLKMR